MEDSSMFIQWALETLQHEHDPAAVGARDVNQHGATDSWSSGDSGREDTPGDAGAVVEKDGWSSNSGSITYLPAVVNTSTMAPPSTHVEAAQRSPATRKRSMSMSMSSTGAGNASSPAPGVMAERKRREKINRRFIELSTVIPGLNRMDKATILSDAVRYVKEQQEKLKELQEERQNMRSTDSAVLVTKQPGGASPLSAAAAGTKGALPEIEVRISESNVMVRIHCDDGKGVLVGLLAEVEGLPLSTTHINVIPCFPDCTLSITITAKVDEGFNIMPEDVVGRLDAVLRWRHM